MFSENHYNKSSKQLNILLAEDEEIYQQIMESYANSMDLKITIVDNGSQCLSEAGTHTYDIILMDIEMPLKNGLEATRELRKNGINTPIIAVTSNTWREDEILSRESGMNDFLPKPVNKKTLEKTIKYWANKRKRSSNKKTSDV